LHQNQPATPSGTRQEYLELSGKNFWNSHFMASFMAIGVNKRVSFMAPASFMASFMAIGVNKRVSFMAPAALGLTYLPCLASS
jgi:hypothetical protein